MQRILLDRAALEHHRGAGGRPSHWLSPSSGSSVGRLSTTPTAPVVVLQHVDDGAVEVRVASGGVATSSRPVVDIVSRC